MKQPMFSVVIANYNQGKYISKAIESILQQDFKDIELIIVDGGSTDESVRVIEEYEEQVSWWVSEKDSGQSDAFNKGFNQAKGKFLFWLNADDFLIKGSLSKVAKLIEKYPNATWISANTIFFKEDESIYKCTNGPSWNKYLVKNANINIYGPSSFFTKDIFEKVGGFKEDLHYCMDTDLWHRFVNLGERYIKLHDYVWGFRLHEESKTTHTFFGESNPKKVLEEKKVKLDNNISISNLAVKLNKLLKFFNGNYYKSYIETKKYKNLKISNFGS